MGACPFLPFHTFTLLQFVVRFFVAFTFCKTSNAMNFLPLRRFKPAIVSRQAFARHNSTRIAKFGGAKRPSTSGRPFCHYHRHWLASNILPKFQRNYCALIVPQTPTSAPVTGHGVGADKDAVGWANFVPFQHLTLGAGRWRLMSTGSQSQSQSKSKSQADSSSSTSSSNATVDREAGVTNGAGVGVDKENEPEEELYYTFGPFRMRQVSGEVMKRSCHFCAVPCRAAKPKSMSIPIPIALYHDFHDTLYDPLSTFQVNANIPNFLTAVRIVMSLPVGYTVLIGEYRLAFYGFFIAGACDFVDGYLARKWNQQTVRATKHKKQTNVVGI